MSHHESGKDAATNHSTAEMDEPFWDALYEQRPALWSGTPNPQLVSEVSGLDPGSALDVGCGEGADAVWLAGRGWTVTATDISSVALDRARANPAAAGATIEWLHADLTTWTLERAFDLVSAQFFHLPDPARSEAMRRMGAAVAPGGRLLIVGHHPRDERAASGGARHAELSGGARHAELLYTPDEVTALFDNEGWHVVVSEIRTRRVENHRGGPAELTDTVVLLRRID